MAQFDGSIYLIISLVQTVHFLSCQEYLAVLQDPLHRSDDAFSMRPLDEQFRSANSPPRNLSTPINSPSASHIPDIHSCIDLAGSFHPSNERTISNTARIKYSSRQLSCNGTRLIVLLSPRFSESRAERRKTRDDRSPGAALVREKDRRRFTRRRRRGDSRTRLAEQNNGSLVTPWAVLKKHPPVPVIKSRASGSRRKTRRSGITRPACTTIAR